MLEAEGKRTVNEVDLAIIQQFKDQGFKKNLDIDSFYKAGIDPYQVRGSLKRLTDAGLVISYLYSDEPSEYVISRAGEIALEKARGLDSNKVESEAALTLLKNARVTVGLHLPHIEEMSDDRQAYIIKELEKYNYLENAVLWGGNLAITASIITAKGERYFESNGNPMAYNHGDILDPEGYYL